MSHDMHTDDEKRVDQDHISLGQREVHVAQGSGATATIAGAQAKTVHNVRASLREQLSSFRTYHEREGRGLIDFAGGAVRGPPRDQDQAVE